MCSESDSKKYREFNLETILTVLTKHDFTSKPTDIYELMWYVFDNYGIDERTFEIFRPDLERHLLTLYPDMWGVNYRPKYKEISEDDPVGEIKLIMEQNNINEWLSKRRVEYGDTLPVSRYHEQLNEDVTSRQQH